MRYSIRVSTFCQSTNLGVSGPQRVNNIQGLMKIQNRYAKGLCDEGFGVILQFLFKQNYQVNEDLYKTGWVVTWFLLGYTVRIFEYTVRTF